MILLSKKPPNRTRWARTRYASSHHHRCTKWRQSRETRTDIGALAQNANVERLDSDTDCRESTWFSPGVAKWCCSRYWPKNWNEQSLHSVACYYDRGVKHRPKHGHRHYHCHLHGHDHGRGHSHRHCSAPGCDWFPGSILSHDRDRDRAIFNYYWINTKNKLELRHLICLEVFVWYVCRHLFNGLLAAAPGPQQLEFFRKLFECTRASDRVTVFLCYFWHRHGAVNDCFGVCLLSQGLV